VREITGGKKVPVVYDGVGKDTLMASLDSLRPRGLLVSFGNASGPVDKFDVGLLAAKGSLYITRPTLGTYVAERGRSAGQRRRPVRRGQDRQGEDRGQPALSLDPRS
jgi:NADPH:quinone reductase-like Zn-dependent oxidoreductase